MHSSTIAYAIVNDCGCNRQRLHMQSSTIAAEIVAKSSTISVRNRQRLQRKSLRNRQRFQCEIVNDSGPQSLQVRQRFHRQIVNDFSRNRQRFHCEIVNDCICNRQRLQPKSSTIAGRNRWGNVNDCAAQSSTIAQWNR